MWRETYDAVLRESASGGACAAERMLTAMSTTLDMGAADPETANAKLSAIGRELVQPLSEVLAMDSKTPRAEKLSRFKLQTVCRLLLCCQDGVFRTGRQENVTDKSRRGKKTASKTNTRNKKSKKAMDVRAELTELLDRIALLIDSANPPSLADGEDDASPFHTFLINVLEKQLGSLLPDVFNTIREVYELTEDDPLTIPSSALNVMTPKQDEANTDLPVVDATSILSALKEERPSKKRSLAATSNAFKEVLLPGQPSTKASTKQRKLKLDPATQRATSEKVTRPPSKAGSPPLPSTKALKRPSSGLSLVSLAVASKKAKPGRPTNTLLPNAMPMLMRNVDRHMLPARSVSLGAAGLAMGPAGQRPPATTRATSASAALSRASIVMRTPDRPQRPQRSQPRILVEASPPLRNPFATARLRRPGPTMPK